MYLEVSFFGFCLSLGIGEDGLGLGGKFEEEWSVSFVLQGGYMDVF